MVSQNKCGGKQTHRAQTHRYSAKKNEVQPVYQKLLGKCETRCLRCDGKYSPTHYLIECLDHPNIRRDIKEALLPQQHDLPAREQAAFIIRRATIIPKILKKLCAKEPYARPYTTNLRRNTHDQ